MNMKCKYCGKEIDEGSVFCGYCGKKQPEVKYCIKCGHEIGLDDAFCGYCGASQNIEKIEKNIAADVQEIQEVQNSANVTDTAQEAKVLDEEPVICSEDDGSKTACLQESSELENNPDKPISSNNNVQEPVETEKVSYNKSFLIIILTVLVLALIGGFWSHFSSKSGMTEEALDSDSIYTNDNIEVSAIDTIEAAIVPTEEEITARIEYMFKEVYENGKDGDSDFLTTEYKTLLKREQEVTPDGEIGYIDSDHWIQGQDSENPSMTVQSVEISDLRAIAKVKIYNFGYSTDVELVLIKERGDWYIDDFIGMYGSEKEGLKDYIASLPKDICPKCGGQGVITCPQCEGDGCYTVDEFLPAYPCEDCGGDLNGGDKIYGTGKILCPVCKGDGKIKRQ